MQQIEVKLEAIKTEFNSGLAYTPFHFFLTLPFNIIIVILLYYYSDTY